MTLVELLESDRPKSEVVELVGYCLGDKADDSKYLGSVTLSPAEEAYCVAWWLYGSLLNHPADEVIVRQESSQLLDALRSIGLPAYASAVGRHDAQYMTENLDDLGAGLLDFVRSHSRDIWIDDYLDAQIAWLDRRISYESDDDRDTEPPTTFLAKARRLLTPSTGEQGAAPNP